MYDHPALLGVTVIIAGLMAALSFLNAPAPRTAPQRASRGVPRTQGKTPVNLANSPCGGWRPLVASYDWPVDTACRILMCESRGDAGARNGRYHSLFQVANGSFDPETNVAQAHAMFAARGWQPWTCR